MLRTGLYLQCTVPYRVVFCAQPPSKPLGHLHVPVPPPHQNQQILENSVGMEEQLPGNQSFSCFIRTGLTLTER